MFASEKDVVIAVCFVNPAIVNFTEGKWRQYYRFDEEVQLLFKPLYVKEKSSSLSMVEGLISIDYLSCSMMNPLSMESPEKMARSVIVDSESPYEAVAQPHLEKFFAFSTFSMLSRKPHIAKDMKHSSRLENDKNASHFPSREVMQQSQISQKICYRQMSEIRMKEESV